MFETILVFSIFSIAFGLIIAIALSDHKDSKLRTFWMKSFWHRLLIVVCGLLIVIGSIVWLFYAMAIIVYHIMRYGEIQYDDDM